MKQECPLKTFSAATRVLLFLSLFSFCGGLPAWSATDRGFQDLQTLFLHGEFKTLEKLSLQELQDDEQSLRSLYFLYAINEDQGNKDQALQYLKRFETAHLMQATDRDSSKRELLIDFRFIRMYYAIGKYYFEQKNYKRSLYWLVMSQPLYHSDPELHRRLGVAYHRTGDFEQSRLHYFYQKELQPESTEVLYDIARSYAREGNAEKATRWLKKAVRKDRQFRNLASGSSDFDPVRASKKFQAFLKRH